MDSTTQPVSPQGTMSPNAHPLRSPTGWLSASRPSTRSRTSVTRYGESLWTEVSILGVRVAPFACGAQLTRNHPFVETSRLCAHTVVVSERRTSPSASARMVLMARVAPAASVGRCRGSSSVPSVPNMLEGRAMIGRSNRRRFRKNSQAGRSVLGREFLHHFFALAIRDQQQDVNPITDDSRRLQLHDRRSECDRVLTHVVDR